MEWQTYKIELLTPCFCAGADQAKAEIRVPSIRGQLRWWFRALGGTREEETAVFGGVHGKVSASSIILRICDVTRGPQWAPFTMKMGSPGAYIWYFTSVAGDKKRWWQTPPNQERAGVVNPDGHLPPGTTFHLDFAWRRNPGEQLKAAFDKALEAWCRFGAIGMRATRGMGAVRCETFDGALENYKQAASRIMNQSEFAVRWAEKSSDKWEQVIFDAEKWLKNDLRKQYNAKKCDSPLGRDNPRQTSAVYFRPVKADDKYVLLVFEAPHEKVLSQNSRTDQPVISKRAFAGNPPEGQVRRR